MKKEMYPKLTIRLFTDQKCFGPGVAMLMHRVEEHRSLRSAAMSMEMAYSKAWAMMRNAEAGFGFKLLHSTTGGRGGGGPGGGLSEQRPLPALPAPVPGGRRQRELFLHGPDPV